MAPPFFCILKAETVLLYGQKKKGIEKMLTLPIKKKWFDMLLSGEKKQEYREIKPYYTRRFQKILSPDLTKKDDSESLPWMEACRAGQYAKAPFKVLFRNGYSAASPSFVADVCLSIGSGKESWGAEAGKDYYILEIQKIYQKEGSH